PGRAPGGAGTSRAARGGCAGESRDPAALGGGAAVAVVSRPFPGQEDQRLKLGSLYSTIVALGRGLVPLGRAERTGGTEVINGCDLSEPWTSVCQMFASASIMSAPVPRAA